MAPSTGPHNDNSSTPSPKSRAPRSSPVAASAAVQVPFPGRSDQGQQPPGFGPCGNGVGTGGDDCDLGDAAALWRAYFEDPGTHTRNQLVERYQGLVREIVRRFSARLPRSVDRGDLLTAGSVGLISAIASFDPARGVRFEAYGERRIKGALLDELRTQDWMPRPWRQRAELQKRVQERLASELGRTPMAEEVAHAMGLGLEEYLLFFAVGMPGSPGTTVATDDPGDGSEGGLDVVPDQREDGPGDRLTRDELLALVAQRLTDQEYRIVYLRYWEELPMREIGELTGISESRVSKIHQRLIERLKDRLRAHSDGG